jgi:hypothetical protein
MKILNIALLLVLFSGICFGFNEAEFKAEQQKIEKEFNEHKDSLNKEATLNTDIFDAKKEELNDKSETDNGTSVILGVIVVIILLTIYFAIRRYVRYRQCPLLKKYLQENPSCQTDNGIKCKDCGSKSIRSFGLYKVDDVKRIHICNSCGTNLYRSRMKI